MNSRSILAALSLPLFTSLVIGASACSAPVTSEGGRSLPAALGASAPVLGAVGGFAVLGGSTVTNTGSTIVKGNLGVSPGLAITGFPPGLVIGSIHAGDAAALAAQRDAVTAYDALGSETCTVDLSGRDLGGLTLTPGVYCFASSAQLTGDLVLDAGGRADAVFVFKTGSTLTSASNASVRVINGGNDCGVFWQVGSSATLGTGTVFTGSILALASITLTTGAKVSGRTLARTGAVTMDTNAVSLPVCASGGGTSEDAGAASDAGTPADDAGLQSDGGTVAPPDAGSTPDAAVVPPVVDAGSSCADAAACFH